MIVAEKFWKNKTVGDYKKLRDVWHFNQRLSYDIQKIIPHVRTSKRVIDLSCGTGEHTLILDSIFNFEKIYLADINESFVFQTSINAPDNFEGCVPYNLNETLPPEIKDSDTVLMIGNLHYVIETNRIVEIFNQLKDKTLIIKVPCYIDSPVFIDKYSEEFKDNYQAYYRTVDFILQELRKVFPVVKYERLYPKDIDSKYGSTQYLFVGKR